MVQTEGLEPSTPWASTECSTKLSYVCMFGATPQNRTEISCSSDRRNRTTSARVALFGGKGEDRTRMFIVMSDALFPIQPPYHVKTMCRVLWDFDLFPGTPSHGVDYITAHQKLVVLPRIELGTLPCHDSVSPFDFRTSMFGTPLRTRT